MEPVLPFDLVLGDVRTGGLTKALHRQLRAAILEGRLPNGFALPSTRRLASVLEVGRNTVVAAYDLLVAEGHARSRPGARLVVASLHTSALRTPGAMAQRKASNMTARGADARIAAIWRQPPARLAADADLPIHNFRPGVPEHRHFDHDTWRRLTARALRATSRMPFNYGPPQGLPVLRDAIAGHAAFVRAVVCEPDDVVVTSGAQQAFDLLARLLVTPGRTRVAVEDPGYPNLRAAFAKAGAHLVPVPVDSEGLRLDRLPADVKVICVTPSHQSPTGAVMSAARRAALLARARAQGATVIEDDYDGEYLFDAHPQDALQTLDRDGRVFYVGTFSKSLFPALRKGFVVAPDWAREALIDIKRVSDSHCDLATQAALADFIGEGHLARHIRRMRPIYEQRRQALERGAQAHWGDWMRVLPGRAGLHLCVRIIEPGMSQRVLECARRHLPGSLALSAYSVGAKPHQGLVVGYGSAEIDQIASAVTALDFALGSRNRAR